MKKLFYLLLLMAITLQGQTTGVTKFKITANPEKSSATRVVVQDAATGEVGYIEKSTVATSSDLNAKENTITPGTTSQYWRGDKTWQTLPTYTLSGLGGEPSITLGTASQYYRGDKTWQTLNKATVGLGNVDNTSDINKPISVATQTFLDLKAPLASPTFTGTVSGITKSMVGLVNVDNTADANKPISTATQIALDAKQPTLVSGTNIKTVNGNSMLGSGDVVISSGSTLPTMLKFSETDLTLWNNGKGNIAFNTSFGNRALAANTTGNQNSAFGNGALAANTIGNQNSAFGNGALAVNINGNQNSAFGNGALAVNTAGNQNSAFGNGALAANTAGRQNSAFGANALSKITINQDNTAFGYNALQNNTANFNSAFGSSALAANTTGNQNSAFGNGALAANTTGSNNVAIGFSVGSGFLNSNNSVLIGDSASPLANNQTNQIVIGSGAIGAGSNTVTIGNTNIVSTILRGSVTGGSFIKTGGTSSEFLKADGSVDSSAYLTGVSSSQVTNALGYTPYNATNPNGFITSSSLSWGNLTGRPTALSQFTNDLGNYGGWITGINSSMVTAALGYTPYNSSNPAGYITSSGRAFPKKADGSNLNFSLSGTISTSAIGSTTILGTENGTDVSNYSPSSLSVGYASFAGSLSNLNISQFTNNSGYITSSGSISGSAGSVAWTNVTGRPTNVSSFTNDSGYITGSYLPLSGGTVSGSITAAAFYVSSDRRLKNIIARDGDMIKYIWKDKRDTKVHYGYVAQEVKKEMPEQVNTDDKGYLSVNYIEVLVAKVNALEKEVKRLKAKLK